MVATTVAANSMRWAPDGALVALAERIRAVIAAMPGEESAQDDALGRAMRERSR